MKRLVILGGGTAGVMAANRLRRRLPEAEWLITIVDHSSRHLYQPGLLLLPFGGYEPEQLAKPLIGLLAPGVQLVHEDIDRVAPHDHQVRLATGRSLSYDYLVIATGVTPRPDQTPGMLGAQWRRSIFDFYTLDGAVALRDALSQWPGGRLVVQIVEMPIKCPVAPLEFTFLADDFFTRNGMRDTVDITYLTPLEGAFTKPVASRRLGGMLADRRIHVEPDFVTDHIDADAKTIVSVDDRRVLFDLLVTIPLNMGADFIERSGLGDELNCVPVDRYTLQSKEYADIFVLGDANDIPASKAGSTAHFAVEMFTENFIDHLHGRPMTHEFDGHANCFVESGHGKGMLIDFNYDTEPLPGAYPLPGVGPFRLLEETRVNHWGKRGFRWAYWHVLLPGHRLPVPTRMSMSGKRPTT